MSATEAAERAPGLIDVSGVPLTELWTLGDADADTVLAHSVRRVTAPADEQPDQSVSAFNSAV